MRKLALHLATCGMMLGSTSRASAASYAPKVGERHPDFTLPTIGDRTTRLVVELPRQEGAADPVRLLVSGLPPARAGLARSDSRVGEARAHWYCWASPRSSTPTAAGCLPSGSGSTGRSSTTRSICWRHRPCRSSSRSTSTASSASVRPRPETFAAEFLDKTFADDAPPGSSATGRSSPTRRRSSQGRGEPQRRRMARGRRRPDDLGRRGAGRSGDRCLHPCRDARSRRTRTALVPARGRPPDAPRVGWATTR